MLFVSIWATGFLVARLIGGHADPLTFLTIRFALTACIFVALTMAAGISWPRSPRVWRDCALAGALMQGVYLAGVFWSVSHGLPAAVCALITGLQPLLTAALAEPLLGERVTRKQWLGILIGFVGAGLVLVPQFASSLHSAAPITIALAGIATVAITLGTIWQKHTGSRIDLRAGAAIQFGASAVIVGALAALTEVGRFDMTWQAIVGLGWSVAGLSVGGMTLLLLMIGRSAVSSVASMFYLVPPVVAIIAFAIFGEALTILQICGLVTAAIGVAVATRV
ncbi:DMT family transporter [Sphingomonas sp. BIUV-7]|uniref:DMT family transporter n=1 Tax=Sphingomonas natans TaxID=3063330 RepID=A0ABT8YAE4_9SPHN|nr:DMT family transporter [Sphingomonas sp. BIUV-7]MDO6415301.1 DMT family transporter [Sphingomonas sp. BIUV-7]